MRHRVFANHLDGDVHQVTNDAVDFAADVANLGELGCFNLDERRFRESRQTTRYLGFADTRRADHQNVLRRDLAAQRLVDLHAAPAIAQRNGDGTLGLILADDVFVQFLDDFSGGHL